MEIYFKIISVFYFKTFILSSIELRDECCKTNAKKKRANVLKNSTADIHMRSQKEVLTSLFKSTNTTSIHLKLTSKAEFARSAMG